MPTTRPRHTITETDEIAHALEAAARRWPADRHRPARLLAALVREGHRTLAAQDERTLAESHAAIDATSGVLTGLYPPGYLDRLRDDWPA